MFDTAAEQIAEVHPDPPRAVPDRPVPPNIARVLGLLHTLIAYGRNLADTLQQHAAAPHLLPCFAFLARIFATSDVARIIARISRGLLRAAALEARLRRRAARGRDLMSAPLRPPSPRQPRAAKPAQPPSLDRMPTPEQIDAEVRRRPIGAVIVDICLDLGIVPGQMDGSTWDELLLVLIGHGGNLANLVFRQDKRRAADPAADPADEAADRRIPMTDAPIAFPEWPARLPHPAHVPAPVLGTRRPAPACTGPP